PIFSSAFARPTWAGGSAGTRRSASSNEAFAPLMSPVASAASPANTRSPARSRAFLQAGRNAQTTPHARTAFHMMGRVYHAVGPLTGSAAAAAGAAAAAPA